MSFLHSLNSIYFYIAINSKRFYNVLAVGIFEAFFILLLIVADTIPQALTSVPVFATYLIINMVMVVLAMFLGTFVTSLYGYPHNKPMPKFLLSVSIYRFDTGNSNTVNSNGLMD